MLDSFPISMITGAVLGFLGGLGIGGGSLLVIWLTVVLGMEYPEARNINLLFFLPCAVISCTFRWKQGILKWKDVLPAIIAGSIAAAVASWIGMSIRLNLLKKCFGGLLILTGIRELLYKSKSRKEEPK